MTYILETIEAGIGLAEKDPDCNLCGNPQRPGACPKHAAPNVLRLLQEEGFVKQSGIQTKVDYVTLDGSVSTAYLQLEHEDSVLATGQNKYSDRPLTVEWDTAGKQWKETGALNPCNVTGSAVAIRDASGVPDWITSDPEVHLDPELLRNQQALEFVETRYVIGEWCDAQNGYHARLRQNSVLRKHGCL